MVMAPIKSRDDVIGLLVLGHRDKNHFTPEDREMATALSSQAAAAIDHAQTFEELKWRQRVNQMEARIATIAASSLDLDAVLDGICREAVIAMKASRVSVWLQDAPGTLRRDAAAPGPHPAARRLRTVPRATGADFPVGD